MKAKCVLCTTDVYFHKTEKYVTLETQLKVLKRLYDGEQ